MRFFDYDSAFMTWFNRIIDMIFISILWFVCCIPIFTAGASTAALYHTIQKCIKNERGHAGQVFIEGMKQNFKKSVAATLILLVILVFFLLDTYMAQGLGLGMISLLFKFLIIVLCIYAFWIFSYMARFECPLKEYMKNSVLLMIRHLSVTIAIGLLGFGSVMLLWVLKPLVIILPSVTVLVMNIMTERVFRLYMSEEDKAMEDELNEDYRDEYIGKKREEWKEQRKNRHNRQS